MYVVAYDISNTRRRNKMRKRLLDYGTPVQLSVFEVPERFLSEVATICAEVLKTGDNVRLYHLCKTCIDSTQTFGSSRPLLVDSLPPAIIELPARIELRKKELYSTKRGLLETGVLEAPSRLMSLICAMGNLNEAFLDVKAKHGCAGSDKVSIAAFDRKRKASLVQLQKELLDNSYRVRPLRVFTIPKSDGSARILRVPCVRDRVAQQAVLRIIAPVWEREFEEVSFAYRTGRSVKQAVKLVEKYRDADRRIVVRADVEDYFDEINHKQMIARFQTKIKDEQVLALVVQWMKITTSQGGSSTTFLRGIPQGSAVSPLLSNIYLDRFDEAITELGYKLVRYADDMIVACKTKEEAEQALDDIRRELKKDSLRLNENKVCITNFKKGFVFLGHIFIGGFVMKKAKIPPGWKIGASEDALV